VSVIIKNSIMEDISEFFLYDEFSMNMYCSNVSLLWNFYLFYLRS